MRLIDRTVKVPARSQQSEHDAEGNLTTLFASRRWRRAGRFWWRIELARSPREEPLLGTCGASESSLVPKDSRNRTPQNWGRSESVKQ